MTINRHALRVIRERTGLSYRQLAEVCGLAHSTIADIETGRRGATPSTIKALADGLAVPITSLIGASDEVPA